MLILAIDTSGQSGGITLAEADEKSFRAIESAPIAGGTFSAQLIPTVAALLSKHGYRAADIGGLAAASGPGSFTGLRVGLSAIKGLAETLHKPIATVSILQAVAASVMWAAGESQCEHPICRVALDASRGEVFYGEYECLHPVAPKLVREMLISMAELAEQVRVLGGAANLATPDASVIEAVRKSVDPFLVNIAFAGHFGSDSSTVPRPASEMIAQIGARKIFAGETVAVEALDANYLRRSDAEIFFKGTR